MLDLDINDRSNGSSSALIQASARNQAAWAHRQLEAHGVHGRYSDWLWSCGDTGPATTIHGQAVTLAPTTAETEPAVRREIERLIVDRAGKGVDVTDWWTTLDLAPMGFQAKWNSVLEPVPYLVRPPGGDPPSAPPPELRIQRVRTPSDLVDFERASFEGYESTGTFEPGRTHAPASLDDPNMRYFLGRVDGQPVSASIAVVSDRVVGIFGVATVPAYRRRGYGTALTWAAVLTEPDLPAVLGPSDSGEPVYRRMGFDDFHSYRVWRRPGSGSTSRIVRAT